MAASRAARVALDSTRKGTAGCGRRHGIRCGEVVPRIGDRSGERGGGGIERLGERADGVDEHRHLLERCLSRADRHGGRRAITAGEPGVGIRRRPFGEVEKVAGLGRIPLDSGDGGSGIPRAQVDHQAFRRRQSRSLAENASL